MLTEINNALNVIKEGGVILYPTDTIWGIGCDATNFDAVERNLNLKGRESGKGFVVLMDSIQMVEYYTGALSPNATSYLLSERSTTVVFENPPNQYIIIIPPPDAPPLAFWYIIITPTPPTSTFRHKRMPNKARQILGIL